MPVQPSTPSPPYVLLIPCFETWGPDDESWGSEIISSCRQHSPKEAQEGLASTFQQRQDRGRWGATGAGSCRVRTMNLLEMDQLMGNIIAHKQSAERKRGKPGAECHSKDSAS